MIYYRNKQTGELLTRGETLKQFETEYDGTDETNMICLEAYYERVEHYETLP